jgi:molybdenum cofactor biosynthesis enzyme MoaA
MNSLPYPEYLQIAANCIREPKDTNCTTIRKMQPKIRFALLTSCQSGCDFCHLEGEKTQHEIGTLNSSLAGWKQKHSLPLLEKLDGAVSLDDVDAVIDIAKLLDARAIHLTGGEPTLHPQICDFVKRIKASALKVTITTHGEIGEDSLKRIIDAGVDSLNFSLHALEPEQYLAMDLVAQEKAKKYSRDNALKYASGRLNLKKTNIEAAKLAGTTVKINSVVREAAQSIQILLWSHKLGIDCRFQKNLNEKGISDGVITDIIGVLNADLHSIISSNGDSTRSSLVFTYPSGIFASEAYDAGRFIIKEERIRDVYFDPLCSGCDLKDTVRCRERFYGLRAGKEGGTLCMDTKDLHSKIDLKNPKANPLLEEIKKHYQEAEIQETFIH